jgi:hypothetical protein
MPVEMTPALAGQGKKEVNMSEKGQPEMISRRGTFRLLGLTVGAFAAAPTLLTSSGVEAQTPGMERRQERRANRQQNRQDRRTGNTGSKSSGTGGKSGDTDD